MTTIPHAVLEILAEIEPMDEHGDNGPGRVVCPACGEWMSMRWRSGARLDKAADMAHDVNCPAVWARMALASAPPTQPEEK